MAREPLTSPDLDLRDFSWMPLDVTRLRDSDLTVLCSGEAFRAAVLLWCAAWHQVPAASLPKDERLLANLAGYGRDVESWAKVRDDALHGFVECSDGRLYHPVVAEKAIEADDQRKRQKDRTRKATDARRNGKRDGNRDDTRNEVHQTRPDQTKTDTTTESMERESPPSASDSLPDAPRKVLKAGLQALGSPLPDTWTPDDELCGDVKREFGMTDDDIRSELLGFHAKQAAEGTYSANWRASFMTWCKRWKEHRDKQAAPRIQLTRSSRNGGTTHGSQADRSNLADIARRNAAAGISFGEKPTGLPSGAREPEGGAPVRMLSEG